MAWIPDRFKLLPTVPAPRCTSQRLPHLLRLLLMYQDNPNRASASRNFFRQNRTCPTDTAFLADFQGFCLANG